MRLCVETILKNEDPVLLIKQPPSCGCVLKQGEKMITEEKIKQPPSCGCVLKLLIL